ncbi:MAG: translation elongation factor Ts [Candidatus Limnocylindrales bacterium]|jgi:elongation factor Ts
MATITAETVKILREQSGAGVMECKRALEETGGDIEKAAAILKERGQAAAAKRAGREANEGQIASYIHTGGKIGVLIEVNCETDFVARTDEFQRLVRDLAIQVAGLRPIYTTVEAIPAAELEAKRAELLGSDLVAAKPAALRAQIVEGQLKKWFAEVVLVEQPFRDQDRTVGQLIGEAVAKTGENIKVRRFVRFELGEEM